jgi:hypothetical protein
VTIEDDPRTNWIADVFAGLLSNGVPGSDIAVEDSLDGVTTIAVRGEVRYRWADGRQVLPSVNGATQRPAT